MYADLQCCVSRCSCPWQSQVCLIERKYNLDFFSIAVECRSLQIFRLPSPQRFDVVPGELPLTNRYIGQIK